VTRSLVLDAEALSALARRRSRAQAEVRAALEAARRLRQDVVTPAVILAELYRGHGRNQVVDACLSRETGIRVRDTDRSLARLVGGVLDAAAAGSEDLADAHAVAVAIETGGGVIVSADPDDMERLAAGYPNVHVARI
jgi:predicted nucleic acid-binding protein